MADTAQISAVNTALLALGKPTVSDVSEASLRQNQSAAKILRVLDAARLTMLERHGWLCAMSYATLAPAQIPGDVNWKYSAVYRLPGDFVAMWTLHACPAQGWYGEIDWSTFGLIGPPVMDSAAWEFNTIDQRGGAMKVLRCNLTDAAAIAYTRLASWEALTAQLLDAIGWDAARRVAWNVTGDKSVTDKVQQQAEREISLAIGKDATQEGGQAPLIHSPIERIRRISR